MSFMKKKMEGSEEDPKPERSKEELQAEQEEKEKRDMERQAHRERNRPPVQSKKKAKEELFAMLKPEIEELIDTKVIAPQVDEVLKLYKEDEIVTKKELKKITDFYESLHNDFGNKIDGHTSQLGALRIDIESKPMTMKQRVDNIKFPLFMEIVDEIVEEKIRGYNFDPAKRSPHYKPFLIFFEKTLKHIKKLNNL